MPNYDAITERTAWTAPGKHPTEEYDLMPPLPKGMVPVGTWRVVGFTGVANPQDEEAAVFGWVQPLGPEETFSHAPSDPPVGE